MKLEEVLNLINWEHAAKIIRNWGPSYFGPREEETVSLEYVLWGMWVSWPCCGPTVWKSSLAAHWKLICRLALTSCFCVPTPLNIPKVTIFIFLKQHPPHSPSLSHQMWGFSVIFLSKTPYHKACAGTQHWSWRRFHCGSQASCHFRRFPWGQRRSKARKKPPVRPATSKCKWNSQEINCFKWTF